MRDLDYIDFISVNADRTALYPYSTATTHNYCQCYAMQGRIDSRELVGNTSVGKFITSDSLPVVEYHGVTTLAGLDTVCVAAFESEKFF